tara:strand:- start:78 stop:302 length:225 start_codon:yes stop_codon:yes gene_type:complete
MEETEINVCESLMSPVLAAATAMAGVAKELPMVEEEEVEEEEGVTLQESIMDLNAICMSCAFSDVWQLMDGKRI